MTARKAEARDVRTGDVIYTFWSHIHDPNLTLTVDYLTFDQFLSPGVGVIDRVRFTGTDNQGEYRENIMRCSPGDQVYIVEEAPRRGRHVRRVGQPLTFLLGPPAYPCCRAGHPDNERRMRCSL